MESTLRTTVSLGWRLASPPGGSEEQPVVNCRNALRSSPFIPTSTLTSRWKPWLHTATLPSPTLQFRLLLNEIHASQLYYQTGRFEQRARKYICDYWLKTILLHKLKFPHKTFYDISTYIGPRTARQVVCWLNLCCPWWVSVNAYLMGQRDRWTDRQTPHRCFVAFRYGCDQHNNAA